MPNIQIAITHEDNIGRNQSWKATADGMHTTLGRTFGEAAQKFFLANLPAFGVPSLRTADTFNEANPDVTWLDKGETAEALSNAPSVG